MGVDSKMLRVVVLSLSLAAVLGQDDFALPQSGDPAPEFVCPETNGKFRDRDFCDLYYVCKNKQAEYMWCPDGKGWDDDPKRPPTSWRCNFLVNVDCSSRPELQPRDPAIDNRCERANGANDHPDPNVCDKYIQCEEGYAYELPCSQTLVFDSTVGTCVRVEERAPGAKSCENEIQETQPLEIDGFTCPANRNAGPLGSSNPQHSTHAHPLLCQFYFSCYYNKLPNKFGCPEPQVFDPVSKVCVHVDEGPEECLCTYACPEQPCPGGLPCNEDCSCPDPSLYEDY